MSQNSNLNISHIKHLLFNLGLEEWNICINKTQKLCSDFGGRILDAQHLSSTQNNMKHEFALNLHSLGRPPDGNSCGCGKTSGPVELDWKTASWHDLCKHCPGELMPSVTHFGSYGGGVWGGVSRERLWHCFKREHYLWFAHWLTSCDRPVVSLGASRCHSQTHPSSSYPVFISRLQKLMKDA